MFARLTMLIGILLQSPAIIRHEINVLDGLHARYLRNIFIIFTILIGILIALGCTRAKVAIPALSFLFLFFFIWIGTTPRYLAILVAIKTLDARNLNVTNHSKSVVKDIWFILGNMYMGILTVSIFTATLDFSKVGYLIPLLVVALLIVFMADWFWGIKTKFAKSLCYLYALVIVTCLLATAIPSTIQTKLFGSAITDKLTITPIDKLLDAISFAEKKNAETDNANALEIILQKVKNGDKLTSTEKNKLKSIKERQGKGLVPMVIEKASFFGKNLFKEDLQPPPKTWQQVGKTKTFIGRGMGKKDYVKTVICGVDFKIGDKIIVIPTEKNTIVYKYGKWTSISEPSSEIIKYSDKGDAIGVKTPIGVKFYVKVERQIQL